VKVYERLASAFAAEGVTDVFGMMGDGNMNWISALSKHGITMYDARLEGGALAMADGWARVVRDKRGGVPGVSTATHGPGVAELATTLLVASRASTPMVVFVGEGPPGDAEFVQRLDQERFAAATETGFVRVVSAESVDESVRTAFYRSKIESRPIMLSAPVAVQKAEFDDFDDYVPSSSLLDGRPPFPHPDAIDAAMSIIEDSRLPVIIAGRGAMWSDAGDAIRRLATHIGALVTTTLMAKTWLSEDEFHGGISGLYSTRTVMELLASADCVISFGAGLNGHTTAYGMLYPEARFIQVDTKPQVIMGGGRSADCYVHADAGITATALTDSLVSRGLQIQGYRTPEVKQALERSLDDEAEFEIEPGTLDPREACRYLDEALPPSVGLVLGGGHQIGFGSMLFTRTRELVLANQHFGCIGQGLTTAIGAVVATGKRPAVVVEGDSGFLLRLVEFETAVRHGLPLMAVVFNDQALGADYHKMKANGLDASLAVAATPNLGDVGISLGGRGHLVRSIEDLGRAVDDFLSDPAPMIVDVRVSRNVLSIPYRRLYLGEDA